MKITFLLTLCFLFVSFSAIRPPEQLPPPIKDTTGNIIIVTLDGFRWQEFFSGADVNLINNPSFTKDRELTTLLYGSQSVEERRKKLMPFMWNFVEKKGSLLGNRYYGNEVNVSNLYKISYPGYNEMFTGTTDILISGNQKKNNRNPNVLSFLAAQPRYKGKVAAVTSWDVFPYILDADATGIETNSGYETDYTNLDSTARHFLCKTEETITERNGTRNDMLTFIAAREYLSKYRPKVLYVGLGETDEYGHSGNYDMYLQKANEADRIIAQLWHWVQTNEGYKNNTTFIVTTDHGRGRNTKWVGHNGFFPGSGEIWVAMFGKGVPHLGESTKKQIIFQRQIAQTIAHFSGERFGDEQPVLASNIP